MSKNIEHLVHKKSVQLDGGKAKAPATSAIEYGEIAINYSGGNETMFIKNNRNEIVSFLPYEKTFSNISSGLASDSTFISALTSNSTFITEVTSGLSSNISTISGNVSTLSGNVNTLSGTVSGINSTLNSHTGNTGIHVTSGQKNTWDANVTNLGVLSGTVSGHITNNSIHLTTTEKTNLDSLSGNIATISGISSTKVSNWDTAYQKASGITGAVGTMAYENKTSYSSATQVSTALAGKVGTGRSVNTASGLTGGGNLSTDRTIGLEATGTSGTYYTVKTDAYGRVISGNTANPNTDKKVEQVATTTNSDYEVLFSNSANNTTETGSTRKNSNITFNPNQGRLATPILNSLITGTGTAASSGGTSSSPIYYPAKWTFDKGVTVKDGDMFTIKIPVAGHSYGVYMSVNNGTNYYPIVTNSTAKLTTHYPISTDITVVYESGSTAASVYPVTGGSATGTSAAGVFRVVNYYDSNTTYNVVPNTYLAYARYKTATNLYKYMLLLTKSEDTVLPVNEVNNTTAATKTLTTDKFDPFGNIFYYNTTTSAATGAYVASGLCYQQIAFDLRYSFNTTNSLTSGKNVYIVAVPQSDGKAKLDTTPIAQNLPTTDDGKIYIYLGVAYSNTSVNLSINHPVYYFSNGKLRLYTVGQNDFGYVKVGDTTLSAGTETDTVTFSGGTFVSLTADTGSNKVSINVVTGTSSTSVARGDHSHSSYVNQNAFSKVKVGDTTIEADTTTDTLNISGGTFVSLTPDATNDKLSIDVVTGTSASSVAVGNHTHSAYVQTGRTITTDSGLTGGGNLGANLTIGHSNSITAGSAKTSSSSVTATPAGANIAIPVVAYDAHGHVSNTGSTNVSLKVNSATTTTAGVVKIATMTGTNNSDTVMTQSAVTKAIADSFAAQDAMVYKGLVGSGTNYGFPTTFSKGATYKVATAFTANSVSYEIGDMFIANTDVTTTENYTAAHWDAIQTNLDPTVYVNTARTITTASGLTGGGNLGANLTIGHSNSITVGSAKTSSSSVTATPTGANIAIPVVAYDAHGHVAGTGSTNVSLKVNSATTATAGVIKIATTTGTNNSDTVMTQSAVTKEINAITGRSVTAGTGLTGGGKLSGDVTVSLETTGTSGTYYTVKTDAYGRVISGNTANPNTDKKVEQAATTTDADYEVLFSNSANNTTETGLTRKNSNITFNPNQGRLATPVLNSLITGTGTAGSKSGSTYYPAKWTFNKGVTVKDGDMFTIKIPVAGIDYGVYMSVDNGTNYYPIVTTGSSRLTTHYAINTYVTVIYESGSTASGIYPVTGGTATGTSEAGVFRIANFKDTTYSVVTNAYCYYTRYQTASNLYRYQILLQKSDTHLLPVNAVNNSTATTKELTAEPFNPFGNILFYNTTTTAATDAYIAVGTLYNEILATITYSFNTGANLVSGKSVYIVAVPQSGGLAKLADTPISQALPSTEDGKIYIYLGVAYNTTQVQLTYTHPVYYFSNGKLRLYTVGQNDFGYVKVGSTTLSAGTETDTVTFSGGTFVSMTADTASNKVSINVVTGTSSTSVARGDHSHSSYANQNAFSKVAVGSTTIEAETTTDTLTVSGGTFISLTPDADNDKLSINVVTGTSSTSVAVGNHTHSAYVQTGRTITTASGLTGGGDLSTNLTIGHSNSITAGSAKTSSSSVTATPAGANIAIPVVAYDAHGHVSNTGSTNVSLKVNSATTATAGVVKIATMTGTNNSDTVMTQSAVTKEINAITGRSVIAGTGLTGGGKLSGDVTISLASGVCTVGAGTYKRVVVDTYGRVTSGDNSDNNTWRSIKVNGTNFLTDTTNALNLSGGTNVTLTTGSSGLLTISAGGGMTPETVLTGISHISSAYTNTSGDSSGYSSYSGESIISSGDTVLTALEKLEKAIWELRYLVGKHEIDKYDTSLAQIISDNEMVTSAALNDLNSRIAYFENQQ